MSSKRKTKKRIEFVLAPALNDALIDKLQQPMPEHTTLQLDSPQLAELLAKLQLPVSAVNTITLQIDSELRTELLAKLRQAVPAAPNPLEIQMDDQLKQLMDYTKFHIGMYTTLIALVVALLGLSSFSSYVADYKWWLFGTLVTFIAASAFGGLVASNIPFYNRITQFHAALIGPYRSEWITGKNAAHAEHSFFWVGIVIAIIGLWTCMKPNDAQSKSSDAVSLQSMFSAKLEEELHHISTDKSADQNRFRKLYAEERGRDYLHYGVNHPVKETMKRVLILSKQHGMKQGLFNRDYFGITEKDNP
jgi:hypothetical protein